MIVTWPPKLTENAQSITMNGKNILNWVVNLSLLQCKAKFEAGYYHFIVQIHCTLFHCALCHYPFTPQKHVYYKRVRMKDILSEGHFLRILLYLFDFDGDETTFFLLSTCVGIWMQRHLSINVSEATHQVFWNIEWKCLELLDKWVQVTKFKIE